MGPSHACSNKRALPAAVTHSDVHVPDSKRACQPAAALHVNACNGQGILHIWHVTVRLVGTFCMYRANLGCVYNVPAFDGNLLWHLRLYGSTRAFHMQCHACWAAVQHAA